MHRLSAELSVSSLKNLLKELSAYREKIRQAPKKLNALLMDTGEESINRTVSGIRDPIGNRPGKVSKEEETSHGLSSGTLSYSGPQVAYIEYGVGIEGKSSPHPKSGEADWKYASGKKIRLSGYWSYYDRMKGKWRSTKGIPAQMPVLKAAEAMRSQLAEKGRIVMK